MGPLCYNIYQLLSTKTKEKRKEKRPNGRQDSNLIRSEYTFDLASLPPRNAVVLRPVSKVSMRICCRRNILP